MQCRLQLSSGRRAFHRGTAHATVRVGYLTIRTKDSRSGLRLLPIRTPTLLESQGYDYDIVTDWELHHEGVSVLDGYDLVMTGSHPEYHTRET